jgi:LacI family transcriptional regulator
MGWRHEAGPMTPTDDSPGTTPPAAPAGPAAPSTVDAGPAAPEGPVRRPTMLDVAARAGVSLKSVSRVVNAEAGVSTALAARVRRAIDELGFRPNAGASSLRRAGGKTSTVGLLLEDVDNPYSSALHRAVEDVAVPRGVMVFSASLDEDPVREHDLAMALIERRADGLILVPAGDDQGYLSAELRAGTAIVCVDRECRNLAADAVVTTNREGAADAVRHLAGAGHRRIGYLGDRHDIRTAQLRHQGYTEALEDLGLPPDPQLVVHDLRDPMLAERAALDLLTAPDPPTALFTAQNLVTIGVVRALRRLGREGEVAVVGFDDFALADLLRPAITVVAQDPTAIGRTAATVLFDRLDGDRTPPRVHLVPTTLVPRGSGEIPPPHR